MQERFFVYLNLTDPPTGMGRAAGVLHKNKQEQYQLAEFKQWLNSAMPLLLDTVQILELTHAVYITCTLEEAVMIAQHAPHVSNVGYANSPGEFVNI
jgi:hypothetical protein